MKKDTSEFYDREMEKLEKEQAKLRNQQIRDQYNALNNDYSPDDYEKILHADLNFTPKKGESYISYATKAEVYRDTNAKRNIQTHINGPKGAWYTHRNPAGCFACEDTNLIHILVQTLMLIAQRHPEDTF